MGPFNGLSWNGLLSTLHERLMVNEEGSFTAHWTEPCTCWPASARRPLAISERTPGADGEGLPWALRLPNETAPEGAAFICWQGLILKMSWISIRSPNLLLSGLEVLPNLL